VQRCGKLDQTQRGPRIRESAFLEFQSASVDAETGRRPGPEWKLGMNDAFVLSKKVRLVDNLKGRGVVTTKRGKEIAVQYQICFPGSDVRQQAKDTPISTLTKFSGQIWCPHDGSFVSVHFGQTMTLCMADGRRLRFSYCDGHGGIAVTEWIG
jgi:hypothetical protein